MYNKYLLNVTIGISPDSISQRNWKRKKLLDWAFRLEAMEPSWVGYRGFEILCNILCVLLEEKIFSLIRCPKGL